MSQHLLRRCLQAIPVLLGVTLVTYLLIFAVAADPARLALGIRADAEITQTFRHEWGLDRPWYVQYGRFLFRAVQGDLGRSLATNEEVLPAIVRRFPATVKLGVAALVLAVVLGVPVGAASAVRQNSALDHVTMVSALLGISTPTFFLGILLAWTFGYLLGWTPISGYATGAAGMKYLLLPAVALGLGPLAVIARLMRSSMLEVMRQEYLVTARAKGLSELGVVMKHALRNAVIPVITTISGSLAAVLSGTFFVEYIFNWPGIGLLAVDAIANYDVTMIQGTVMFAAIIFVLTNICVDVVYAFIDPRISYR